MNPATLLAFLGLVALTGVSGCLNDPYLDRIVGTFSSNRTQADLDDFQATVEPFTDEWVIMESFPEQFSIRDMKTKDCERLHKILATKSYISSMSVCLSDRAPDPNEETSSS